jgi:hypothetical protein
LGGADFWRNKAKVEHVAFLKPPVAEGDRGAFTVRNRYVGGSGAICEETYTCTFLIRRAGYLILWDSVFSADQAGFYVGDQEERGRGRRVATPMLVNLRGPALAGVLDDQGRRNEKKSGVAAASCDWRRVDKIGGDHRRRGPG